MKKYLDSLLDRKVNNFDAFKEEQPEIWVLVHSQLLVAWDLISTLVKENKLTSSIETHRLIM